VGVSGPNTDAVGRKEKSGKVIEKTSHNAGRGGNKRGAGPLGKVTHP